MVGSKEKDGERYYKVHWKGYPSSEDSWEPEKNLKNCDDLIEEYNQESSQVEFHQGSWFHTSLVIVQHSINC